jgi:hypothetical protein
VEDGRSVVADEKLWNHLVLEAFSLFFIPKMWSLYVTHTATFDIEVIYVIF